MNELTIGEKIKVFMNKRGIKQTFVAETTGIPQTILNNILNGKRNIYADEYALICKALRVSLEEFFPNEEAATKEAI